MDARRSSDTQSAHFDGIRPEQPDDAGAIRALLVRAFDGPAEARLVDALRAAGATRVSLVALRDGAIVGHVVFSPVRLEVGSADAAGLAPLAVVPEHARRGIGAALVREGLAACARDGVGAAVVLGDPRYYGRFGFLAATRFGLRCAFDAPEGAFQAMELRAGALAGAGGVVRYAEAFHGAGLGD